ncbi:hypothetical protein Cob_v000051 [Colletotrichum orbiculare MAFF 240422]|uniref:Uncharacterized protein n=1 Tax=Colletotrichum orbiculare (strain 104-T / ATCC 96160 / CBS 514.97 / LARS 414 / MAFF 240422) TaxID=1213857 RepID=A0A484GAM4_COLOR|nr:hypothetical protein Cob_v000051 [Colletotrichum orbiculare MAFF 240422]
MTFRGAEMVVRKIEMEAPLASGTSGTWVGRNAGSRGMTFCGMVVAIYPGEPTALFLTAKEILDGMTPLVTQLGYSSSRGPLAGNLKTETKDGPIEAQMATQDTPSSKKPKKAVQSTGRVQRPEATNRSPVASSLTRRARVQEVKVWLWTCCSCGDSGMRCDAIPACPGCYRQRCQHCPVYEAPKRKRLV